MQVDFNDYFYYDETSPSCLRWKINIMGGRNYKIIARAKDSIAGSKNNNGYYLVELQGKSYRNHRIIYNLFNGEIKECIDHIDGDKSNNKISNLREITRQNNNKNRGVSSRNKSGKTGIFYCEKGNQKYWIASWQENKVLKQKCFSIKKFGDEEAFNLACNHRDTMLELDGNYTERHGK